MGKGRGAGEEEMRRRGGEGEKEKTRRQERGKERKGEEGRIDTRGWVRGVGRERREEGEKIDRKEGERRRTRVQLSSCFTVPQGKLTLAQVMMTLQLHNTQ